MVSREQHGTRVSDNFLDPSPEASFSRSRALRESTVFPRFVNFTKFRTPPRPAFLNVVNHFELALCVHFQDYAGAVSDLELMIRRVFTPKGENVPSKPQRAASNEETETTSTPPATSGAELANLTRDDGIRRRAYEIYLEREDQLDRALDDWLQAERELADRLFPEQAD